MSNRMASKSSVCLTIAVCMFRIGLLSKREGRRWLKRHNGRLEAADSDRDVGRAAVRRHCTSSRESSLGFFAWTRLAVPSWLVRQSLLIHTKSSARLHRKDRGVQRGIKAIDGDKPQKRMRVG